MSTFRNIIARRRPSGPGKQPETDPMATRLAPASLTPDMLVNEEAPRHPKPLSRPVVVDEVPRWEIEAPTPTMGEDLLRSVSNQLDDDDAPEEMVVDTPEDDPLEALAEEDETQEDTPLNRIWDIDAAQDAAPETAGDPDTDEDVPAAEPKAEPAPEQMVTEDAPAPTESAEPTPVIVPEPTAMAAPAPAPARGGRVKTRLLGFHSDDIVPDVFAEDRKAPASETVKCPVGWVVIVDGPGRGTSFALAPGLSTLGRGSDQTVALDFGDDSISRNNHASIAYDEEDNEVLIGHGGKSNLVRLNGKPLVSSETLTNGDAIRVGKTTLRFVALCGPDFSWSDTGESASGDD